MTLVHTSTRVRSRGDIQSARKVFIVFTISLLLFSSVGCLTLVFFVLINFLVFFSLIFIEVVNVFICSIMSQLRRNIVLWRGLQDGILIHLCFRLTRTICFLNILIPYLLKYYLSIHLGQVVKFGLSRLRIPAGSESECVRFVHWMSGFTKTS